MKTDNLDRGPQVRIGVIQSIDSVELSVNTPAKLFSANGEMLQTVSPKTRLRFISQDSKAAHVKHVIRLAKIQEQDAAEKMIDQLKKQNIPAEALHVGEVLQLEEKIIDNREYWIVTGNFENAAAAQKQQAAFYDFEDQTPVAIPLVPPDGEILLDADPLGAVVRVVPDDLHNSRITVANVRVGIEFHWDHREEQDYSGIVEIRFNNDGKMQVINELAIEDYLTSVNSSEMTPDCPMGLLKAQTIAARSTIFATMGKHHFGQAFHLCADDHCQCYRGTRYVQETSARAVNECLGETLFHNNRVCDARYAKSCGGVMESFEHVWENIKVPYLISGIDGEFDLDYPLYSEEKARAYIDANPDVYCNTDKYKLPKMLEFSNHLFRWKIEYTREELEEIIAEKTGEDIGELQDIVPLERGESGRLKYINIVGSKKKLRIGKELAIRRVLSKNHVYSSCFYVEKTVDRGRLTHITLVGAGWGHGVGLCQVGATIMAQKDFSYQEILAHYFKNSSLIKIY